ncbi:MAG: RpiB/LacA/LacB family sugar-phosphate isomerase [Deltaproteobacteria bacterium]|jgi:ribose 5-phosphate isomerase RpiB|nr:RpiB/LacA/LacB family sugar-phosphate isomerase [Deltaproteobacteria bacterium]
MQLKDWVNTSLKTEKKALKVGIFSDKESFFFKEKVGIYLDTKWTSLYDIGPSRLDQPKDIFKMALKLGKAIEEGKLEFGIALLTEDCGAITVLLNKFKNVRAVFAADEEYIKNSRKRFDANVIVVKNEGITIDAKNSEKEVSWFLETAFDEENRYILDFINKTENINV